MLQATVFAVGVAAGFSQFGRNQSEFGGHSEQGDVAEVAGQAVVLMGVAEDQVLDDELDVDDAAGIVLEVESGCAFRGVRVIHLLAHGDHFFLQLGQVALLAEYLAADRLEAGADRRVAGAEAGPGQRLVFPDPGLVELVVAEGIDRYGEQAGVAVRAQAQVGLEQDAGRGLARQPGVQALAEACVVFLGIGVGVVEEVNQVKVGDVAEFLAAQLAVADDREFRASRNAAS